LLLLCSTVNIPYQERCTSQANNTLYIMFIYISNVYAYLLLRHSCTSEIYVVLNGGTCSRWKGVYYAMQDCSPCVYSRLTSPAYTTRYCDSVFPEERTNQKIVTCTHNVLNKICTYCTWFTYHLSVCKHVKQC
jgi:hypothetical protein